MGERTDATATGSPLPRRRTSRTPTVQLRQGPPLPGGGVRASGQGRRDQSRRAAVNARPITAGDLFRLDRRASVQFCHPVTVRVIREIVDRSTFDGWTWIEAYELDGKGEAVAKRELFVQPSGLRRLNVTAGEGPSIGRRARTAARPRVPA